MVIKKKKSIREQVYDYLKGEIVSGNIKEETRIVEEEYAEKLNISRTPLREALRMLELEGLVEAREKGGVTVPRTTKKDVEEVVKIRIALETVIFEELFQKVSQNDIKKLEENIRLVDEIVNDEKKSQEVFKYFSEFNKILYKISDLPRVIALINNLNLYLKKFRKISAESKARRLSAHKDHLEIVALIKEGKKEEAITVNRRHLLEAKEFLIKQVNG
ncbi:GntR family transcriptional regulator [Cetobacterium sp. 8H]|uniref:GntR family transcriptional regulator n=1 Tax=Cetobacterium sp. 8H TaxID=2759681 RepID=UPI00163C03E8|nr:GntR family transcriptional regulator [Cetobacterium sp. 8H]MBC2851136.1 GntR family transcriptional regulator [Cetobacterium sp. 8H]